MVTSSLRTPNNSTSDTAGNCAASRLSVSARRLSSRSLRSPCTATRMNSLRLTHWMTRGCSMSRGMVVIESIRTLTSFMKPGKSTCDSASTLMEAWPSLEVERTHSIASMSRSDSSMRATIWSSTSWGVAPGQEISICRPGKRTCGSISRSIEVKPMTPATKMPIMARLAATVLRAHHSINLFMRGALVWSLYGYVLLAIWLLLTGWKPARFHAEWPAPSCRRQRPGWSMSPPARPRKHRLPAKPAPRK